MVRRIVVLNPKGGSGKTTVATNLAAYYASLGISVALVDRDPQGSSSRWLSKRNATLAPIHVIATYEKTPANVTRSFLLRIPAHVRRIVVDTPAAVSKRDLTELTRDADKILVPVLPSDIDIHAATRCVADLLIAARVPRSENRLAVVANRVKQNTLIYRALMRFLDSLEIPVAGVLRDSQNYIRAFECGHGLHELKGTRLFPDLCQWQQLIGWIERGPTRSLARMPLAERALVMEGA